MEISLPYGLQNDHLVTIDEVLSGLDCRCECPACHEKLIARKGPFTVHHFAHQTNLDCNKGVEASLHRLCREIIAKEKRLTVPALLFGQAQQYEIFPETEIAVDAVRLQYMGDELVPDIVVESKGHTLLVEITANQRVSPEKRQLLISRNMAAIEINITETLKDLFEINDFRLSNRAFRKELISHTMSKHW
ncbi:MAG TPA: competence protein CoiA family protein, partial [Chitinophagaceae bacterium]|nr:competence protein CoiA family protein [Chitinophagaceae bacterium]